MTANKSHLEQGQRLAAVWGPHNQGGQIGFSVNIHENVWGRGYRFVKAVE